MNPKCWKMGKPIDQGEEIGKMKERNPSAWKERWLCRYPKCWKMGKPINQREKNRENGKEKERENEIQVHGKREKKWKKEREKCVQEEEFREKSCRNPPKFLCKTPRGNWREV